MQRKLSAPIILNVLFTLFFHLNSYAKGSEETVQAVQQATLLQSSVESGVSLKHKCNEEGVRSFRDPAPISFNKNSEECQNWVMAHRVLCGEKQYQAAKALLESLDYVSFEDFKKALAVSVEGLKKKLGHQKFAVIIDRDKSSEWVLSLIRDQLKDTNYSVVYSTDLPKFLRENSDLTNYVRMDDAVYSGEQVVSFYRELSRANYSKDHPVHLHVAVPYQTSAGRLFIEDFAKKPNLSGVSISLEPEVAKMDTLEEKVKSNPTLFPNKFLEAMFKMFPTSGNGRVPSLERTKKVTNIFFQHKVPDGISAIDAFLRFGWISCGNVFEIPSYQKGENTDYNYAFNCVPRIVPPYKNSAGYPSAEERIREHSKNPSQTWEDYNKDQESLLEKIRSYRKSH